MQSPGRAGQSGSPSLVKHSFFGLVASEATTGIEPYIWLSYAGFGGARLSQMTSEDAHVGECWEGR
jgi:hypothetical protein